MTKVLKAIQHEVVLASAVLIAIGEGLFTLLAQPWQGIALAAWPLAVAFVARTQTVPVAKVKELVDQVVADLKKKPVLSPAPVAAAPPAPAPPTAPPSVPPSAAA